MKKVFVIFVCVLISINAISQDIQYRKDDRPQNVKEDGFNFYQVDLISKIDILKALEIVGVRIFSIPISPVFEKEYKVSLILDEYVEGKKINSQDIPFTPRGNNTYVHFIDNVPYFDYISNFTVFTHDNDTMQTLKINHYGGSRSGINLKKNKVREWQSYHWRAYSKVDWKLNEEVPLLVFASTWLDERFGFERFCGVADLSMDEEATRELLDFSPHYFVLSLKVSE